MRKIVCNVAAAAALVVSTVGAAGPAQATTGEVVLRNQDTGLCIDRPAVVTERPMMTFTAECDGAASQRWVYSEAEHTIVTPDTGLCFATGSTSGIAVAACDSGLLVHWGLTSDGRIHQLDWGIGCVEDYRTQWLTWGGCDMNANEVWSLTAA